MPESYKNNDKIFKKIMKFFSNKGDSNIDNLMEMVEKGKNAGFSLLDDEDEVNPSGTQTPAEYFEQPKKKKGRPRKVKILEENSDTYPEGKNSQLFALLFRSS